MKQENVYISAGCVDNVYITTDRVQYSTLTVNLRPLLGKITWYYTRLGTKTPLLFVTYTIHILLSTEVLTTYMLTSEDCLSIYMFTFNIF